jgi:hypothetical protein
MVKPAVMPTTTFLVEQARARAERVHGNDRGTSVPNLLDRSKQMFRM